MVIKVQALLADAPLQDPKTLRNQQEAAHQAQKDPLIAHGWETTAYIGAALLGVGLVALVGIFSRKIEHVIIAALFLTIVIIGFFLVVGY